MRFVLILLLATGIACAADCALAACPRVELTGEVSKGSGFEREVGKEFVFRLKFTANDPTGWEIEVYPQGDRTPEHELSGVVTTPYRSWNGRYIIPGWGMSARQVVAADHEFQFLAKPEELDHVDALRKAYLWPYTYSTDEIEKTTAELYRVLEGGDSRIAVCTGRLTVVASRVSDSDEGGAVEWLKFKVHFGGARVYVDPASANSAKVEEVPGR